jgi:hypothetical protein
MNGNLLFDFTIDKTTITVLVNKEFAADHSLVRDAFTKQEIRANGGHQNPGYYEPNLLTLMNGAEILCHDKS